MSFNRRRFVRTSSAGAAFAVLGLHAGRAGAQGGPLDTVKLITGFPPGGTSDTLCRRVAENLRGGTYTKSAQPAVKEVLYPPITDVETTQIYVATLTTDQGPIEIELNTPDAPCTVNNFRSLLARHFYDNTPCHRLTTQGIYVLQCGDPTGKGTGGPGYTFADENLEGAKYPRGTVAMANSGPSTNGSQFFLVYKDTQLDPNYTPFGTITKGLDLIEKVAAAGATPDGDGKPKMAITILSAHAAPKKA